MLESTTNALLEGLSGKGIGMSDEVSKLLGGDLIRLGLTQEEFATRLGVTQQAVSAWYARNAVPQRRLKDIESVLGVDSQLVAYMRNSPQPALLREQQIVPRVIREAAPRRARVDTERQISSSASYSVVAQLNQERRRFRELIESELPGARVEVLVGTNHVNRQFDYMSDALCIDLISLTPLEGRFLLNSGRVYAKLVSLMLCRLATAHEAPDRHFGIIVVADDPNFASSPHVDRLQWECEQFDITLTVVPRIEAAAEFIVEIENSLTELRGSDDIDS
jgi:transcriptional regulator with XRE-family HTH domain